MFVVGVQIYLVCTTKYVARFMFGGIGWPAHRQPPGLPTLAELKIAPSGVIIFPERTHLDEQ
jgi:hypothetical protein